jgi:hypothetical protein
MICPPKANLELIMEIHRSRRSGARAFRGCIFLTLSLVLLSLQLRADQVVLHLTNGDRIAGEVVSESDQEIVVNTPWAKGLSIPSKQIQRSESPTPTPQPNSPSTAVSAQTKPPASAKTPRAAPANLKDKPKAADRWKFDTKLGADMIRGERDRDIYYGQFALLYARPYDSNPRKFFRNKLDYRVDYGTTDRQESANRMFASDKADLDIGERAYAYNNLAGGFDEVRKIRSQIEVGPGIGYHIWRTAAFVANAEVGLTYQNQNRKDTPELESAYARLGQDCTWKLYPRIIFTQSSVLLASMEESDQMQFRLEANLAFGIVQNLSLNLTAVELYDTRPAPGVSKNEFQLRSALGITF